MLGRQILLQVRTGLAVPTADGVRLGKVNAVGRAGAPQGLVRDLLVPCRGINAAARRGCRNLRTGGPFVPRVIITAKLASDGAAKGALRPDVFGGRRQHGSDRGQPAGDRSGGGSGGVYCTGSVVPAGPRLRLRSGGL